MASGEAPCSDGRDSVSVLAELVLISEYPTRLPKKEEMQGVLAKVQSLVSAWRETGSLPAWQSNISTSVSNTPGKALKRKLSESISVEVPESTTKKANLEVASDVKRETSETSTSADMGAAVDADSESLKSATQSQATTSSHMKGTQDERQDPSSIPLDDLSLVYMTPDRMPNPPKTRRSFTELFHMVQTQPTAKLIPSSHKTLSTDIYKQSLLEGKLSVVYLRIDELKRNDKWSLRQISKAKAPPRRKCHGDYVLDEALWMRTSMHQRRRHKIFVQNTLSKAVLEWFESGTGLRSVNPDVKPMALPMYVSSDSEFQKLSIIGDCTEGLTPLKLGDLCCIELDALNDVSKEITNMLPPQPALELTANTFGQIEGTPFVAVSKFLSLPVMDGGWRTIVVERPKKLPNVFIDHQPMSKSQLYTTSKLFGKSQSHDYHHEVRAPKPPDVRYLSQRAISLWLPADDQRLLLLARDLKYNWELVSNYFSVVPTGGYTSNIERRTPWQCFERWLQLNKNFDQRELKGRYAEQARIWLDASFKTQQATKRRLMPLGIGADNLQRGHKQLRWSSMLDCIRKSTKKRENQPKAAPTRRYTNPDGRPNQLPARVVPSAMDLSRIKFERDKAAAEAYAQQRANQVSRGPASRTKIMRPGAGELNPGPRPLSQPIPAPPAANAPNVMAAQQRLEAMQKRMPAVIASQGKVALNPQFNNSIAGIPMPSSVVAAAAVAAGNTRLSQEQLQMVIERRRRSQLQEQRQLQTQQDVFGVGKEGLEGLDSQNTPSRPLSRVGAHDSHLTGSRDASPMTTMPNLGGGVGSGGSSLSNMSSPVFGSAELDPSINIKDEFGGLHAGSPGPERVSQNFSNQQARMMNVQGGQMPPPGNAPRQSALGATRIAQFISRDQYNSMLQQVKRQNPTFSDEQVQQLAGQHIKRYIQKRLIQKQQAQAQAQGQVLPQTQMPNQQQTQDPNQILTPQQQQLRQLRQQQMQIELQQQQIQLEQQAQLAQQQLPRQMSPAPSTQILPNQQPQHPPPP